MREFLKSLKFKLLLCLIAMLIGVMLYTVNKSGYSTGASKIINTAAEPFKKISSAVSEKVSSKLEHVIHGERYYSENEKLKEELSQVYNELVDYENTKAELSELQKFIGIKEEHSDYALSPPCKIISYTANDPFGSFMIDKGSNDGIALYDPVVTAEGLVGAVTEISEKYCTVTSILSPSLSVGVIAKGTVFNGVLEGDIKYSQSGLTQMIYIDKDNTIKQGDLIVTNGSSGLFPADYIVGTVTETGNAGSALSSYAIVKPFVDVTKISSVMVITSFDGKGEINEY
ncbi:MAG: rod shape-determining protein MreC [Oscillospiraceae bacterium]|nr:rod shape-determining protein MreC [Oscillospiraceae bacterium]